MRKALTLTIVCWAIVHPAAAQLPTGTAKDWDNKSWSRQLQPRDGDQHAVSLSPVGGDAVLSIPIDLPRGAGGFTPTLSVDYDSGDLSNGPVGIGWRLGFARIERRNVPNLGLVTEFVSGTRRSRLIDIGAHDKGRLFAPLHEPTGPFYLHYTDGDYWAVADAGGTEWVFGRHVSLRQATRTSARSWYLEEATDTYQHRIVPSYIRSGDELLLSGIGYVERDSSTIGPRSGDGSVTNLCTAFFYCVELEWTPRPDPLIGAHDGAIFWLRHRLERIDLKSAGALRLSWLLRYASTTGAIVGRTERSLLERITRRGYAAGGPEDETLLQIETSAIAGNRWSSSTWDGIPPPFPNGLSTVADFDGDGRSDVMGVLPYSEKTDTWVFTRSEGSNWFDAVVNGTVDPARALKVAWPPGPYRFLPFPIWAFFKKGDPCYMSIFDPWIIWELPPAGSAIVGDYDANGLPDIAFALPTAPTPPSTTVRWEMFLSTGDGWLGSSRDHPVKRTWSSGPVASLPKVDCKMPRRYSLGVYCRGGKFDPDDRDDIACFLPERKVWQVGHAARDDWEVEEVDASAFAPAIGAAPMWGEDCLSGDLDGNGIDEIACPSASREALEVLRRNESGQWKHETWPVEMATAETLVGCLSASLNEDALMDIICSSSTPGQWLMAISDGRRFRQGTISSGFNTRDLHEHCFTADMDNDSRTDLVCLDKAPNRFVISYARGLELSASETFEPPIPASISTEPGWCRFGDFNGDTALDAVCVASDFGSSIVTQSTIPVADELKSYTDALGAVTRVTFTPAADEKLSAPVIRRRYLKTVELDPGAGQPVLRRTFSYGGKYLGLFRAPIMTYSSVSETAADVGAAGITHLSSNVADYEAWGEGAHLSVPILKLLRRLDSSGCTSEQRELAYDRSVNAVRGAPRLISLRESAAAASPGSCAGLVETRTQRIDYDSQDRALCTMTLSGSAGQWQANCLSYEPGNTVPSLLSDRPPRVVRAGMFASCEAEDGSCRDRANYAELVDNSSAPAMVRVLARRRFDFVRSLPPCEQRAVRPAWTNTTLSVLLVNESGAERRFSQTSYDRHGNTDCEGLANGAHDRFSWHSLGHTATNLCDFSGKVCSRFEYSGSENAVGQLLPPGLLTRLTMPWGSTTEFVFDALGRLTALRDTDRGLTKLERSNFGNPARQTLRQISPSGEEVEMRIDGLGRSLSVTHRPVLGQPSTVETHYDGLGRITRSSAPYFRGRSQVWKKFAYDGLGRVTAVLNLDGSTEAFSYAVNEVTYTDALGVATRFRIQYSEVGEQLEVERTSEPMRLLGHYTLDGLGRTTSASDASGLLARWSFDSFGDLVETSERAIGSTVFTYDDLGRQRTARNAQGVPTFWTYDTVGRPARISTGRWPNRQFRLFRYDDSSTGLGRVSRVSNQWTEYSWKYDEAARTQLIRLKERSLSDSADVSIVYSYDELARVSEITLPDRRTIGLEYSGDRVLSIIDLRTGDPIVTYAEYDDQGLPAVEVFGDGTRVLRGRDQVGRLASIVLDVPGMSRRFAFAYTLTGNLREVIRDGVPALEVGFDEEGHIAAIRAEPATNRQFTYDGLANTETVTPGPRLEYGKNSEHPHAVSTIDGESILNDGLMRAKRFGPASIHYRHETPSGVTYGWRFWRNISTRYDAIGRPYFLRSSQGDEKRAFGLWRARWKDCHVGIPSPFGTVAISRCGSSSYEFVHGGAGSVLAATSQRIKAVPVVTDPVLDPYEPMPRPELEALLRPTTFTLRDGELQLQGQRIVASSIGRFLQPDPVYPPESSPFELNRYAFARSNPLRFTDPLGRQSYPINMTMGWPGGQLTSGQFSGPTFNFFDPTLRIEGPRFGTIVIGSEFSAATTSTSVQSVQPASSDRPQPFLSYGGEPLLEFTFSKDLSIGSSFAVGPTISATDGSVAQSVGIGPVFVEGSTDGTATLGLSFGPSFRAGNLRISVLEAGPIVSYQPATNEFSLGLQGRAFAFSGLGKVSIRPGSGLIKLYQDLQNALNPYRCGSGCAWFR